jgi:hypothetical protein
MRGWKHLHTGNTTTRHVAEVSGDNFGCGRANIHYNEWMFRSRRELTEIARECLHPTLISSRDCMAAVYFVVYKKEYTTFVLNVRKPALSFDSQFTVTLEIYNIHWCASERQCARI